MRAKAAGAAPGGAMAWAMGLICGGIVVAATPVAVMLTAILAPSGIALALDAVSGRSTVRPVVLIGIAMAVEPLAGLWRSGGGIADAMQTLGEPRLLAIAWSLQAAAWLMVELLPVVIALGLEATAAAATARLRASRRRYEELWDMPPP